MRGDEVRLTFKWYAIGDTRQMRRCSAHLRATDHLLFAGVASRRCH